MPRNLQGRKEERIEEARRDGGKMGSEDENCGGWIERRIQEWWKEGKKDVVRRMTE